MNTWRVYTLLFHFLISWTLSVYEHALLFKKSKLKQGKNKQEEILTGRPPGSRIRAGASRGGRGAEDPLEPVASTAGVGGGSGGAGVWSPGGTGRNLGAGATHSKRGEAPRRPLGSGKGGGQWPRPGDIVRK